MTAFAAGGSQAGQIGYGEYPSLAGGGMDIECADVMLLAPTVSVVTLFFKADIVVIRQRA